MLSRGLLSVLPSGWFSSVGGSSCPAASGPVAMVVDSRENKRRRESCSTPPLMASPSMGAFRAFAAVRREQVNEVEESNPNPRPAKRIRKDKREVEQQQQSSSASDKYQAAAVITPKRTPLRPTPVRSFSPVATSFKSTTTEPDLKKCHDDEPASINSLPVDAVSNILSFLGTTEDRSALQNTSKLFRNVSNEDAMLKNIDVGGDMETGKGGIIQEHDTPATACTALTKFANAGNLQAQYLYGVIKCYCYQDLNNGIRMLETASKDGYVRAKFTLGIILRDTMPEKSARYMKEAADEGYFPALQEILPAREMKERMGAYTAEEIRQYLDPVGLTRLLTRDYVNSAELRGMNTSHCWNPLCGKWAFKAGNSYPPSNRRSSRNRRGNASALAEEAVMDPPPFEQGYGRRHSMCSSTLRAPVDSRPLSLVRLEEGRRSNHLTPTGITAAWRWKSHVLMSTRLNRTSQWAGSPTGKLLTPYHG
eukprot:CAMPEP_0113492892 /NCGR_PEP_ID=MMETSP0014_2-20120614/28311_1 /TAXON_ID=2857 /ORGANISM="Nitzschia sp." /LENGTH=478 /DNA_ID=CAMNT_0000386739 /DNA_START=201 /DNA_END=1638 /DNA_ORIENTATION=- /assembly_acc=CAM_ASM_000159